MSEHDGCPSTLPLPINMFRDGVTGLMALPTELRDDIFEMLCTKDRRSLVNTNKKLHKEHSARLHRELGLLDISSMGTKNTLSQQQTMSVEHYEEYGPKAGNIQIHLESMNEDVLSQAIWSRVLATFTQRQTLSRDYIGFTDNNALDEVADMAVRDLLAKVPLGYATVIPRVRRDMKHCIVGAVLGVQTDHVRDTYAMAQQETTNSFRRLAQLYIRPQAGFETVQTVQREHSKAIEELLLFWPCSATQDHDDSVTIEDILGSILNPMCGHRQFRFDQASCLTRLALYNFDIARLESHALPTSINSLTMVNNIFRPNNPWEYNETKLLQALLQAKATSSTPLIEFIHVQRVRHSSPMDTGIERVHYDVLLDVIRKNPEMMVQCIHQPYPCHGHSLADFATPSLEKASHRFNWRTFAEHELLSFAIRASSLRKYGMERHHILQPFLRHVVTDEFIRNAESLARALSPMQQLNTLCLFAAPPLLVPLNRSTAAHRALRKAVKHLSRVLLQRGVRISLIIVAFRDLSYNDRDWAKVQEPYLFRVETPSIFQGTLKEIDLFPEPTLTHEERMDLIKLGADRVLNFADYERMSLGDLYMDEKSVAGFKEVRYKRRAIEENLKADRHLLINGMSARTLRKRKYTEMRKEQRSKKKAKKRGQQK